MLQVQDLHKEFGSLKAVDGISFTAPTGRIFGLLGPNGAGKTTTISMVCGLLRPTKGHVLVDGVDISQKPAEVKRSLGVVPQEIALYEDLTARENLNFWGGIYELGREALAQRVDELLELVGLSERAREPVRQFSGGMKRRLNLAMGMIHQPKLLLLDEPTVGIDPQARENVLGVVHGVVERGTTVLYTTHYLEEAERICDELAIMDQGKILAQGSIGELKAQLGEGTLLTVQGEFLQDDLHQIVAGIKGLRTLTADDGRAMLAVGRQGWGVGRALEALYGSGLELHDVSIKEPNLQDLFLKLTGRELRD